MATYKVFPELLTAATASTLNWEDFWTYMQSYGFVNNGTANYVTLDRANQLLTILKVTEPNDLVTHEIGQMILEDQFHNDSKEVIAPSLPSLPNPVAPIQGVLDFLKLLTEKNTWIRVAEFLVGGILLVVGANALLKQSGGPDVGKAVPKPW
jgi:hypothetical protein